MMLKNNSEWGFCVFFQITKTCFFKVKTKNLDLRKSGGLFFLKIGFFYPDYLSILFCDFPMSARSGTSHVTISLIGCAPHT